MCYAGRTISRRTLFGGLAGVGVAVVLAACGQAAAPTVLPAKPTEAPKPAAPANSPASATKPAEPTKPAATTAASGAAATKPAETAKPAAAPATGSGGRVVVNLWHNFAAPVDQNLIGFADRYNKENAGVEVKPLFTGTMAVTRQKVTAALAAKEPPQISSGFTYYTVDFADSGVIVPAQDFLFGSGGPPLDDYWPVTKDTLIYKGKVWAVPLTTSLSPLYWNKQHFAAAGIQKGPETWDDLLDAAKKTTVRKDGQVTQWGISITQGQAIFLNFLYQNGGKLITDDATKMAVNTDAGRETLQYLADMVQTHKVAPPDLAAGENPFKAKTLSMNITTATGITRYKQAGIDLGVGRIPYRKEKKAVGDNNALYVFNGGPANAQQAAIKFLQWFLTPTIYGEWIPQIGHSPVIKSSVKSAPIQAFIKENPEYQLMIDELDVATALPPFKGAAEVTDALQKRVEAALRGAQSVKDALAGLEADGNKAIAG